MKNRLVLALSAALFSFALSVEAQMPSTRPHVYAVFDAVLDSLYNSQGDKPDIVIVADSLFGREGGIAYRGRFLLPHRSLIRQSTIESFDSATLRSIPFPTSYRYKGRLHVLSALEFSELQSRAETLLKITPQKELKEMPYWMAFVEKYPAAWGVTVLSQPGFSRDSTEALMSIRHQCGGGCYSSEVILLDRLQTGWKIVERINAGSAEAFGIGSLRYLGPGAHFVAMMKQQADSSRRAFVDSVRADAAPRRIRGTVINGQTGRPIAHAQIFLHTARFPTEIIKRYVADSKGRYEIRNPPLGSTMLELQCPGSTRRSGRTLDAPAAYVAPMLDVVIDMKAPNIEPCWESQRIKPFASGELTSPLYLASPYPSSADIAVYSAVVNELHLGDSAAVSTETRSWCRLFHQCPALQLAHLERLGILDSTTFPIFQGVASDSVRLNPSTLRSLGIPLLSVGERTYLTQEARRASYFSDAEEGRDFWTGLRTNHPGVSRILSFTRVGYDIAADQAMVSYHIETPVRQLDETLLLRKADNHWTVLRRHLEAERISAEIVNGRCVPSAPGARPSDAEFAGISGDFDFRMVSSATDNRVTTRRISISNGDVRFDVHSKAGEIRFSGTLLIRDVSTDYLFGEWSDSGFYGDGIPVDKNGNAIPPQAGYFCAKRIGQ
ncbi:MAG TPA: hypothetical protein VF042_01240 [Gemmatimonadaceae bacterium]